MREETMPRPGWLRVGLALSRGGDLVPWINVAGLLVVVLVVALSARACG